MNGRINGASPVEKKRDTSNLVNNPLEDNKLTNLDNDFQALFTLESRVEDKKAIPQNTFNEECGNFITKINNALDAMDIQSSFKVLLQFGIFLQKSMPGVEYANIVDKLDKINKEEKSEFDPSKPFYNQNQVKEAVKIPDLRIIYFIFEGSEQYADQMGSAIGKISEAVLNGVRIGLNAHHTLLLDENDTYSDTVAMLKRSFEGSEMSKEGIEKYMKVPANIADLILKYADPSEDISKQRKESIDLVYNLYKEASNKYLKDFLVKLNLDQFEHEISVLKQKVKSADFLKDVIRLSLYVFLDEQGQVKDRLIPIIADYIANKTFISDHLHDQSLKENCQWTDNLVMVMQYFSRLLLKVVSDGTIKNEETLIEMQQAIMDRKFMEKALKELEIERRAVKQFLSTYMEFQNLENTLVNAMYELNKQCKDVTTRFDLKDDDFSSFLLVIKDIKTQAVLARYLTYIGEAYPGLLKNIFDTFMIDLSAQFTRMVELGDQKIIKDEGYLANFENKFLKICDLLVKAKQLRIVDEYLKKLLCKSENAELNQHDFRSVFRQIIIGCSEAATSNFAQRNKAKLIASPKAAAFFGANVENPSPTGVAVTKIAFASPKSGPK